ncbi:MAG: hypothetical protein ACHQNE_06230, partial [Candidatus Kapaibacterium sp.]
MFGSNFVVINNNVLLAIDTSGNVLKTENSGGDSLLFTCPSGTPGEGVVTFANSPQVLEGAGCSTLDTQIYAGIGIVSGNCETVPTTIDSVWLKGSAAFRIIPNVAMPRAFGLWDSIPIAFTPDGNGIDSCSLHLRYSVGLAQFDTMVTILGRQVASTATFTGDEHHEVVNASYRSVASMPLLMDVRNTNLDSLWPYITDLNASISFDSTLLQEISYTPPAGWSIVSNIIWNNRLDF